MKSFTAQGFTSQETGGGCSAWVKKLPTGQYMVLTSNSPLYHHLHHDALIGIYDGAKDGDELWGNLVGDCELEFNEEETEDFDGEEDFNEEEAL